MVALILEPWLEKQIIARRRETGTDRFDEVWDGVYMVMPTPDNEHQDLAGGVTSVLLWGVERHEMGKTFIGCNVSDREDDWARNYRWPDAAVFLKGTRAIDRGTHWLGGPDFAAEIVSPYDRTREKFDFYARVGTRELLVVDRAPWALELYRLNEGELTLVGRSTLEQPDVLTSAVLPLSWRLVAGEERPRIEVAHADGVQRWMV